MVRSVHSCHMGYQAGRLKMACHAHASPLDLRFAVATSCNAYFCYVFRDILDNPKYGSVKEGYDVWKQYVESFGFGRKLGSDFLDEGNGYVPDRAYYDRQYRGSWNSLTVLSLSIGQDALGCTPLQLANLACIVANRGYYYIPHIVKKIEGQDSLDARFYERHYTMVEPKHFEPIVEGIRAALKFDRAEDVSAPELQKALKEQGIDYVLEHYMGLEPRPARRIGRLRQDRNGRKPARPRPLDLSLVRTEGQSEDRHFGLRRKRRIRRLGGPADRQPAGRVLPDGHDPQARTAAIHQGHEHLLSRL